MSECFCPTCGQALMDKSGLRVDLRSNVAILGGISVLLSAQLAEILSVLVDAYPAPVQHDRMIQRVWGVCEPGSARRTLQAQICYLRRALLDAKAPVKIATYYEHGYGLLPVDAPDSLHPAGRPNRQKPSYRTFGTMDNRKYDVRFH